MQDVIELNEPQSATTISPLELNQYEKRTVLSKKAIEARETLEICPPPAKLLLRRYTEIEQKQGINIMGILKRANMDNNTFVLARMKGANEIHYHVHTTTEMLNNIIKIYWSSTINVQIRPQINQNDQFEYELMSVI